MTNLVVLFNLKEGVDPAEYEAWAQSTDLPIVRGLASIEGFSIYRTTGLLGSDENPPYQYVEFIDIGDMARFGEEVAAETMQRVAAEFQERADNPLFISAESIE